jgi:hypothetical protein
LLWRSQALQSSIVASSSATWIGVVVINR